VSADRFVTDFVARLRAKAGDLRTYGAEGQAAACERNARDLEDEWRAWWLADLTVAQAAEESGYSEERLREMARDGALPHKKGNGPKGQLLVARRDLPRRPKATDAPVSDIGERLLRKRRKGHLRPAS
jgi:hypothetical protein